MGQGGTHPHPAYPFAWCEPMGSQPVVRGSGQGVLLGDEVVSTTDVYPVADLVLLRRAEA